MYTVLCAFEDRPAALRSIKRMIMAGLPRDDIHVQPEAQFYLETESEAEPVGKDGLLATLLRHLRRFLLPDLPGAEGTYRDAIRKGSTVVVVHVADADDALDAARLMAIHGAFDVEHCRTRWINRCTRARADI